jgi:DNA-binding MarR family transcriptional regulator
MDSGQSIIRAFIRILERADAFRHGHEELFGSLSLTEIHGLDAVGSMDHANVTKVADALCMTRGGGSKVVRRLEGRGYIESFREPENRKEIYFRLTEKGRPLYEEHRQCHQRANRRKARLLEAYSEEERQVILRFLEEMRRSMDPSQAPCD